MIEERTVKPDDLMKACELARRVRGAYFEHGITDLGLGFACLLIGLTNYGTGTDQTGFFILGIVLPGLAIYFLHHLRTILVKKHVDSRGLLISRFPFWLYCLGLLIIAIVLISIYGVKATLPVVPLGALLYATILIALVTRLVRFWYYFGWFILSFVISITGYNNELDIFNYPWLSFTILGCIPLFVAGGKLLLDYIRRNIRIAESRIND